MVFTDLCPPALIYLLFSITQVVIDTVKGLYNTALIKIWVAVIFTILLNYLCQRGLGIISWLIVFVPFILMTLVVSILLLMFGLDPSTGKIKLGKNDKKKQHKQHKHHKHGTNFPEHKHHKNGKKLEDKKVDVGEDKILDYYNKYSMGEGGGGGGNNDLGNDLDDNMDKKNKTEKDKKILQKSFLFYSTKEEDSSKKIQNKNKKSGNNVENETNYNDENSINNVKYNLFVDEMTNMLYSMGEQDIASWFKNKSTSCLENLDGLKKDDKQKKIEACFQDILDEIMNKFNNNKKNLFKKNYKEKVCQINETMDVCKNRVLGGLWK
tara:strand:+ start:276 stop:1244 length:969 start_codon:yes stop_codon:yes gene_type:complete